MEFISKDLTSRNAVHQLTVCFEKRIFHEPRARRPFNSLKYPVADVTAVGFDNEERHFHVTIRIAMLKAEDFRPHLRLNAQLFMEFPCKGFFQILAPLNFSTGKLPLHPVGIRVMALADEN